MTNTIGDIEDADVILVTGSNTTENHPVLSRHVKRAVSYRGAKLILVDPRRIKLADFCPQVAASEPGHRRRLDQRHDARDHRRGFIRQGFRGETHRGLRGAEENRLQLHAGLCREHHRHSGRGTGRGRPALRHSAKAASILYCMGITQHSHGTDNVKSLANLAMLCGHMGKPGTGVNPLRGQNNVQGACDMGGLPNVYTGYQPVSDLAIAKKMEEAWGVKDLPTKPGLTVTEMIPKAHAGELKALYIIGENPLVSDPDLNHAEASIKHLDFLVVQDIFLTETAQLADVVLPSRCFAEKNGTFSNTERRVQLIRKAVEAPGECKDDWQILCDIATRMGTPMAYAGSREICEEIARVTPSYAGITYDRIAVEGLHWPCPTPEHPGTPILHREQFTRGRGMFHAIDYTPPAELTDDEYPLYLTTGRVLYHYHTGTMTMKSAGLNERVPECFVEISPKDAALYDLTDGAEVEIASRRGKITAKIQVSPKAVNGTVFIPFHFAQAAANRLTNAVLDPVSKIPEYKVCAVKLSQAA